MRRFVIACLAVAGLAGDMGVVVNAANPSAALGQWANLDNQWVNGNLGTSKSTYYEADSIPYRLTFDNLSIGSHQVTIEWDTTKSGKHALDYLTTFNYRVGKVLNAPNPPLNPCAGVSGCGAPSQTQAIPPDPQVVNAGVTPAAGVFTIYGGTVDFVDPYSYADGTGFVGDKSARITIHFTATQPNPVLAWGGHIAARKDWGIGLSAVAISGSPYHTRLIDLDGAGGNQDRSLSAAAVIFPAILNVVKDVQTASGGADTDSTAFPFTATGQIAGTFALTDDGAVDQNNQPLHHETTAFNMFLFGSANSVMVTEGATAGFTQSTSCTINEAGVGGGAATANGLVATVVPAEGMVATCLYVNKRADGTLTVIKTVINDNGGQAEASSFTITVKSGGTNVCNTPKPGAASPGFSCSLPGGTYVVSEALVSGYTQTGFGGDCDASGTVNLPAGGSKTCTITNNDQPATLTVIKHVVNDNGGNKTASDFTMTVTGGSPNPASFSGSEAGTSVTINAGTFSVTEGNVSGYTQTSAVGCSGTIANGGSATCTITNDDNAATLIVKKIVINDNGGSAKATDFTFKVNNGSPIAFQSVDTLHGENSLTVDAGTYSVTEPSVSGYTPSFNNCSNVVIANGETQTCTISNDDAPAAPSGTTVQRAVLHDKLTIGGIRLGAPVDAQHPAASVTFRLYSDSACSALLGSDGPVSITFLDPNAPTTGTATTVNGVGPVSASPTTIYYWTAQYTGDQYNTGFTTDCTVEKTTVVFEP
jgi:Prealbumin-like fold domain